MKNQTKRLVRIFTPFAALILSVGSLTTAAVAWFTFTMSGSSDVTSITVKGGASLAMKYYDENITIVGGETSQSGYDFYSKPAATSSCDYSTNFISTAIGTAITIDNTSPRAAFSYAFEITNASKTYVDLYINDYSCTEYKSRVTVANSSETTDGNIYLSEAVNIYTAATANSPTSSAVDTAAQTFLSSAYADLTDQFAQTGSSLTTPYSIASSTVNSDGSCVFFMTILFSDDSSTFYTKRSSGNYVLDSTDGDSSVYNNLDFLLSSLYFVERDS